MHMPLFPAPTPCPVPIFSSSTLPPKLSWFLPASPSVPVLMPSSSAAAPSSSYSFPSALLHPLSSSPSCIPAWVVFFPSFTFILSGSIFIWITKWKAYAQCSQFWCPVPECPSAPGWNKLEEKQSSLFRPEVEVCLFMLWGWHPHSIST